jgi:formylmethanofuran dehydrogenase subunit E
MPILGMYTSAEVANIKRIAIEDAERTIRVQMQKEINKLKDENTEKIVAVEERYGKAYGDLILDQIDIEKKLECKQTEVYVLRTILALETDKKIRRLEVIGQRTKKARVRKKCENRIIGYKMRKIAYEAK